MFYLFEVKNLENTDVAIFETKDEAVAEYHKRMASAVTENNAELLMVVNEKGLVTIDEYFIKEVKEEAEEVVAVTEEENVKEQEEKENVSTDSESDTTGDSTEA